MEGRSAWWKTNRDAVALILAADPGLVAGVALAAGAGEAGVPEVVPGLALALDLAASTDLTQSRDGSLAPDQGGSPAPNPQRNLAHAPASHTAAPRATSLAPTPTPASHAPRADQKSKLNGNPEVAPRRNLLVRSLRAALRPVQRVEMKNVPSLPPSLPLPAKAVGPPSPQPSDQPPAPRPAPSPALDPDQLPKIDHFSSSVLKLKRICEE